MSEKKIELPSVCDCMVQEDIAFMQFIKPGEKEIRRVSGAGSPFVQNILTLPENRIVPVHRHHSKWKSYLIHPAFTRGRVSVIVWDKEGKNKTTIMVGPADEVYLQIPAGHPHAVVTSTNCQLFVTVSKDDPQDIEWESRTEELLRNEHLKSS